MKPSKIDLESSAFIRQQSASFMEDRNGGIKDEITLSAQNVLPSCYTICEDHTDKEGPCTTGDECCECHSGQDAATFNRQFTNDLQVLDTAQGELVTIHEINHRTKPALLAGLTENQKSVLDEAKYVVRTTKPENIEEAGISCNSQCTSVPTQPLTNPQETHTSSPRMGTPLICPPAPKALPKQNFPEGTTHMHVSQSHSAADTPAPALIDPSAQNVGQPSVRPRHEAPNDFTEVKIGTQVDVKPRNSTS